ncbi:MAG: hypothetical protein WEF50_05690 [Myxococcota bacterium]
MRVRAWALTFALVASATPSSAAELGFVYVRANVGGASGGHAALVAGETVYHMQSGADGLVRLTRDRWQHFRYLYADLQNRPLEVAFVALEPDARERVLVAFTRLYVEQDGALARRDEALADVAWLEAFRDGRPLPELRSAGLLAPERANDADALALRARIGARLAEPLRAAVAAVGAGSTAKLREYRDALTLRESLRALDGAWGLEPDARVALPPELDAPLDPAEREGLASRADELERTIVFLLDSRRVDRGSAILLAQARYLAVRRSLAENRLVLLDPFDGAPRMDVDALEMSPAAHAQAVAHAALVGRRVRAQVLAPARVDEPSYTVLEEAGGTLERVASARDVGALFDLGRRRLPARGRSIEARAPAGDREASLREAKLRLDAAQRALDERYAYDLVRRNCITELVRVTDQAFGSPDETRQALGGRIAPGETFGFVPFVFFDDVRGRLRVSRVEHVPSFRERELERIAREEPGVWPRARESTTLFSTAYQPLLRDGAFLLFTDDVFWRRPLYGAANLFWASGYTLYGVGAAPFDRGARLRAGLLGAFWSLPELAFQNVRKGSYEWVSSEAD